MHWITLTHTRRWHKAHGTVGIGHLYQGRYKSFPVQQNWRYLKAMRYIEANPVRAGIVETAADWNWSSFALRDGSPKPFELSPGPVPLAKNWAQIVDQTFDENDSAEMNNCIKRGCPYGEKDWTAKTAEILNLQSTLRKRGRPRKYPKNYKLT